MEDKTKPFTITPMPQADLDGATDRVSGAEFLDYAGQSCSVAESLEDDYVMRNLRSVEDALAYLTECHLATLEHEGHLKSTSKSSRERFQSIADMAVAACKAFNVDPGDNGRLRRAMAQPRTPQEKPTG